MIIRFDDPVQQEVWAIIRALNDAWTKGKPSGQCHPCSIIL